MDSLIHLDEQNGNHKRQKEEGTALFHQGINREAPEYQIQGLKV